MTEAGRSSSTGMIQLLVLGDARMAQALVDYLATLGIPCELTQSELGVSVWLADERRLAQAQQEVKRFLSRPNHPRYMEASWQSRPCRCPDRLQQGDDGSGHRLPPPGGPL